MQTKYTKKVKRIDKKYFHRTNYANVFDFDILHNKIQLDISFYTYKTLFDFNNLLSYYQLSKDKTNKAIEMFESCKIHINSKYEKCYDKYCIEIYEYLMNCYDEILECIELGKKPNWNSFVDSITPYINDIIKYDFFGIEITPKINEIKTFNSIYQTNNKITFNEEMNCISTFEKKYYKLFKKEMTSDEFYLFYDLLIVSCNIYDLLYNNADNKSLNIFLNNNIDKTFLDYMKTSELGKQFIENYNKQIIDYKDTIIKLLGAFFNEYVSPISTNVEIIDSYNMLKLVFTSIKDNNIPISKLIIKELLRKHKDFLKEVSYEKN